MVTNARKSISSVRTHFLTALILAAGTTLYAKGEDVYRVAITLHVGGKSITGFLHSVSDSSVSIIPGAGSLGFFAANATVYTLLFPIESHASYVAYSIIVPTATICTLLFGYVKKHKPKNPSFTLTMQKYCLVRSGIVANGS